MKDCILFEIVDKKTGKHHNWTPFPGKIFYDRREDAAIYLERGLKIKKVIIKDYKKHENI
jgi:hypothetical protein